MASEAEIERLYQEWIRNGAGNVTLTGIDTPAAYYDESSAIILSPSELAELQARQAHYNRTEALKVVSSEIGANNFNNPYNTRSVNSIAAFNQFNSSPGVVAINSLSNSINSIISTLIAGSSGSNTSSNSSTEKLVFMAALAKATGVDFDKLLLVSGLSAAAVPMFGNLQSHTNSQTTNLPETLEQVSSLADLNKQFGEGADSCSIFNELMGIMSGTFDGVMDFLDAGLESLTAMLGPILGPINDLVNSITGIVGSITGAIGDVIDSVVGSIKDMIPQGLKDAFSEIGNIASSMMNGISEIANQIASEIANLVSMAASIASKLQALALAAAALDPCKLLVLMNTGSSELKGAINQLTSPVTNIAQGIQTELDPRANPDTVQEEMRQATQAAQTAAGVPQSPMTPSARMYTPFDSYLHDIRPPSSTPSGPSANNPAGNNSVATPQTDSKFGTEEKFAATETTDGNTEVEKLPETGSETSDNNEVKPEPGRREFESKALVIWRDSFVSSLMRLRKDADSISRDIKEALSRAYFPSESLKSEAKTLGSTARKSAGRIKSNMGATTHALTYLSDYDGLRIQEKEDELVAEFNNIWSKRTHDLEIRTRREIEDIEIRWNSIKSQIIIS